MTQTFQIWWNMGLGQCGKQSILFHDLTDFLHRKNIIFVWIFAFEADNVVNFLT